MKIACSGKGVWAGSPPDWRSHRDLIRRSYADAVAQTKEEPMNRKTALLTALVLALSAAGVAIAAGGGDDDQPLHGATLERATAAALAHTGGGAVLETEHGDDGAAYGVEIRLADGRQVEVELNDEFRVVGQEADDDSPGESDD
jgi:uncharacterized membrane protein YkoI